MADIRLTQDGLVLDNGGDDDVGIDRFDLAVRAAGQVAAQNTSGASVFRGARSGNSNFDPSSGRFAPKAQQAAATGAPANPVAINESGVPQGVSQEEWNRRKDSVREAARTIATVRTTDDVQKFLEGRVQDLSKVDIEQFTLDVQHQKLDDLTDVLAQTLQRGRNEVSIRAPRSFASRVLSELDDQGVVAVLQRLRTRGFSDKDITKKIIKGRIEDKRRDAIISAFGSNTTPKEKK